MTTRKPAHLSFPGWVEAQIVTAQRAGAFDDLPGKGKPIPGLDRPQHELEWVANYLRREDVEVAAVLPPALALAKEVEDLPVTVARLHSAARVRAVVADLNDRIRAAHRAPQVGPPLRVRVLDPDAVVAAWQAARPVRAAPPAPPPTPPRRWWQRRRSTIP